MASVRLQIRKHRSLSWTSIALLLKTQPYELLWTNPTHTSTRGNELVCTFRIWSPDGKGGFLNLDNSRYYKVWKKEGRV